MQIWQAIVLGAVQGFTEFLPVSSSGHLILLQHWFGIEEGALFYSVMLHIGTLIPVVISYLVSLRLPAKNTPPPPETSDGGENTASDIQMYTDDIKKSFTPLELYLQSPSAS